MLEEKVENERRIREAVARHEARLKKAKEDEMARKVAEEKRRKHEEDETKRKLMVSLAVQKELKLQNESMMNKMMALQKETHATIMKIQRDASRAIVTERDRIQKEADDAAMELRMKLQKEQKEEIEQKIKAIRLKDEEERRKQEEARLAKIKLDAEYKKVRILPKPKAPLCDDLDEFAVAELI